MSWRGSNEAIRIDAEQQSGGRDMVAINGNGSADGPREDNVIRIKPGS